MARIPLIVIAVLIVIGELIDRVVSQMHKVVLDVVSGGPLVRFSTEPRECHFMQVDPQRVHPINHHVKS